MSSRLLDTLFATSSGERVYWQKPNLPLNIALTLFGFAGIASLTKLALPALLTDLAAAWFLAWSYLEASQGVNLFRKILGYAGVLIATLILAVPH